MTRLIYELLGVLAPEGSVSRLVLFEDERPKTMPDQHFIISLKDRLRLPVCPPGATCKHHRRNGILCGHPLDLRGKHALKCEVGPIREARGPARQLA